MSRTIPLPCRALPLAVLIITALALPASSQAARASGTRTVTATVLQASPKSHLIRVVTDAHAVRSYHVKGRFNRWIARGARLRFVSRGADAYHVVMVGRTRKVKFYGRVVRSGNKGLVLKLGDGQRFQLNSPSKRPAKGRHGAPSKHHARAHMAGDITISVEGLKPGQTVLITLTLSPSGDGVGITIRLVDSSSDTVQSGSQQLSGTVTSLDPSSNSFTVTDANGDSSDFTASDGVLMNAALQECDRVDVTYHVDGDTLVADDVQVTGSDASGNCGSASSDELEALGTVAAIDATARTITITTDDGQTLALAADPSVLDGVTVGEHVDVLYSDNGDGTFTADGIAAADPATQPSAGR
jgi:hypothetical protein